MFGLLRGTMESAGCRMRLENKILKLRSANRMFRRDNISFCLSVLRLSFFFRFRAFARLEIDEMPSFPRLFMLSFKRFRRR